MKQIKNKFSWVKIEINKIHDKGLIFNGVLFEVKVEYEQFDPFFKRQKLEYKDGDFINPDLSDWSANQCFALLKTFDIDKALEAAKFIERLWVSYWEIVQERFNAQEEQAKKIGEYA